MKLKLILISIFSLSTVFTQCEEAGGNSAWQGDGWCDSSNNNEACAWDLGDCCPNDCVNNVNNGCPDAGGCYAGDGVIDYCGDCTVCSDPNSQDYEDCGGAGTGGTTGGGATGGGTEPTGSPTNVSATGDFGSVTVTWSAPSGGGTGGGNPEGVGEACTDANGYPGITDCALNCVDEATATSWIGDGYCDGVDQQYGMNLDCEYFSFDGGDCDTGTGGTTGGTTGGGNATCAGYCGGVGSDGSCYCDDLCEQYGDCCADYYDECAGGTTGGTTTGGTTGGGNAPDGWTCDDSYYLDSWCDCGCGVYDLDCDDPNAQLWENCDEGFGCEFGETECTELVPCEDQGLVTCWDGSCANTADDCPDQPFAGQDCCELVDCEADPTFVGLILDCSLEYCFASTELGDGACTDYTAAGYPGVGFNCEELSFDSGDCTDGVQFSNTTPSTILSEEGNYFKSVKLELTKEQFDVSLRSERVRKQFYSTDNVKRPYYIGSLNNFNRDLLGYNVYRDGELVASNIAVNNTTYSDYSVIDNTDYCYQVSAVYTEGESDLSNSSCASSLGEPDATLNFSGSAASGTLDVQMSSSVDVAGFQFELTGGTVTSASGGMAADAGFQISSSEDGIVLGFSFDGSTIPAGDGNLVSVTFEYDGVVDICMETVVLSNSDGNPITVSVGGCESTEITVILGDVNGDLSINVLDILVIVNSIVGSETLSPPEFEAADMNFDGSANVVDIIAIVNIILGDGSAMNETINDGIVTIGSNNIKIKSDGSIAGFELDVEGDYSLDNSQLPGGWNFYSSNNKVLAFTTDGKNLSNEIIIPFEGSIKINSGLITDLNSSVVYTETNIIPDSYLVSAAYPNPFNPVTQFEYALPEDVNVSIFVYDASGSKVIEIQNGFQSAGSYSVSWDASTQPSGIYFVRFIAGDFAKSEKVMLLK